jgi:hypothetical protein
MKVTSFGTFSVFRNVAVFPRVAVMFGGDVKIWEPGPIAVWRMGESVKYKGTTYSFVNFVIHVSG